MTPPGSRSLGTREAKQLGHHWIGCEHQLLGILANEDDVAAKVLVAHGVTLDHVRGWVADVEVGDRPDFEGLSWTPRATVVSKLAEIEAERLGELRPRPGHVLLALITEGQGVPAAVFNELGVDIPKLREDLLKALGVAPELREVYLRQRTAWEAAHRPPSSPGD